MSDWDSETQRRYDEDVAKGMPRLPGTQLAEPVTTNAGAPLLDRGALVKAIADEFNDYPEGLSFLTALDGGILPTSQVAALAADAVLPLARPMPTREQIAEVLHHDNHVLGSPRCKQITNGDLTSCYERRMHDAEAVLTLISGSAS